MGQVQNEIISCNFVALYNANYIHEDVNGKAKITSINQNSMLAFAPKIPVQVLVIIDPVLDLEFKFINYTEKEYNDFIQAEVIIIDPNSNTIYYQKKQVEWK